MMVMTDIYDYINALTPPLSRDVIYRELVQKDATITRGTVTKALKDLGYTTKRSKSTTGCGICHLWVKQEPEAEAEPEKTEPKSTEQIIEDVEERNEQNNAINTRLLESLKVSRDLKETIMQRQREALVSMARQVLSLFGDDYEQQRYRP